MVAVFKAKFNEDDDDVEELVESSMPDDEQEFLDCEMEHDIEFSSFNQISCFSHTLQLVVSKFDELDKFKELMKRAHAVVRKFNSSTKATERLIAICGKRLVKDCPTRWNTKFLMLEHLIDVKDSSRLCWMNRVGMTLLQANGGL